MRFPRSGGLAGLGGRRPTLWGGLLIVVSQLLRLVVSRTDGWLAFARWATGLARLTST
jgi:hypothetical protein